MKLPTKATRIATTLGVGMAAFAVLALPVASVSAASDTSTSVINGVIGSSITVSSAGPININVTPTSTAVLSSAQDTVTVDTNNAGGYTLSLQMNTATRTLAKGADTIAAHTATPAAPSDLAANSWGFRVDGNAGFGAGTTSAESNIANSAYTWAGVPAQGSPAATIKTTTAPASGDATPVWYAMKADASKPSGTYTNTVLYTAVTN